MKEKQVTYKILPDGSNSRLSLNSLYLCGIPYETVMAEFNFKVGNDILSNRVITGLRNNGINQDTLVNEIGRRLAAILYVLKKENVEFLTYNIDVLENDRRFWKECRFVYFAGYYFRGEMGRKIREYTLGYLADVKITDLSLKLFETDQTPSLVGCGYFGTPSGKERMVFDFGHTNVKRGIVRYCGTKIEKVEEFAAIVTPANIGLSGIERGNFLNEFIVKTITDMYFKLKVKGHDLSEEVVLCIANNIICGRIMERGYYGELALLGENYPVVLKKSLQKLSLNLKIHVLNDVKAITYLCTQDVNHTAVISLGTNLGIGYPGPYW